MSDELCRVLGQVEQLLLTLAEWEADPETPERLPAALAGGVALEAVQRLVDAVGPAQTVIDDQGAEVEPLLSGVGAGRVLGANGTRQYRHLRLIRVAQRDLECLSSAAIALGLALAIAPESELADVIAVGVQGSCGIYRAQAAPIEVVTGLARLIGVLDLAVTVDTQLLISRLELAAGADVVLTSHEELAYQRVATQVNVLWPSLNTVGPLYRRPAAH